MAGRGTVADMALGDLQVAVVSHDEIPEDLRRLLSPAQCEVAAMLLNGASTDEIAAARGTAVSTASNQIKSIYRKLGVSGRRELAQLAAFGGVQHGANRKDPA